MPKVQHLLAVSALGPHRDDGAEQFLRAIVDRGGEIADCRIMTLGTSLSLNFLIAGDWSALGRLESALPGLAEQLELHVHFHRTQRHPPHTEQRPYNVELLAPRDATLTLQLMRFFAGHGVGVVELTSQDYESAYTGAEMCNVQMLVHIPLNQHPAALRESFMDLCDELHADGILDPIKT